MSEVLKGVCCVFGRGVWPLIYRRMKVVFGGSFGAKSPKSTAMHRLSSSGFGHGDKAWRDWARACGGRRTCGGRPRFGPPRAHPSRVGWWPSVGRLSGGVSVRFASVLACHVPLGQSVFPEFALYSLFGVLSPVSVFVPAKQIFSNTSGTR